MISINFKFRREQINFETNMGKRRNKKKKKRQREGDLAAGVLPDYVEPSTRDRVPNKVDSTGKLNVCHGLIDRKNRCVGRQASAEKSLPNCSRFMGYAIVIPCQISPVFTLRSIIIHVCRSFQSRHVVL